MVWVTKLFGGMWDLPSEPEMNGKGKVEWFMSPHKATEDDIISQNSKVVQVVFIHHSWRSRELPAAESVKKFGICQQMQNMCPPLPATARSQHSGDGKMGVRKKGGKKNQWTTNVSTVFISSIPYQCQTVLGVCPELSAAKQGSCTFDGLAFYEAKTALGEHSITTLIRIFW